MFTRLQRVWNKQNRLPLPDRLQVFELNPPATQRWYIVRLPTDWLVEDSDRALINAALHADRIIQRGSAEQRYRFILSNCYFGHLAELSLKRTLEATLAFNGQSASITTFDEVRESVLDAENEFDLRINGDVLSVKSTTLAASDDAELEVWLSRRLNAPPRVDRQNLTRWRWHCQVVFLLERRGRLGRVSPELARLRRYIRERAIHLLILGGIDTEYLLNQQVQRERLSVDELRLRDCSDGWHLISKICERSA